MQDIMTGMRAYGAAAAARSGREREADVFRRANGALKAARNGSGTEQVRAISDNRRLWSAVLDLVFDPASPLPAPLRGAIASIGLAVQREVGRDVPNLDFLIAVNENIAAGLAGES
ncbi:MAG: flagellar biosynthesis regulator FlaF [Acetobacteraceae bacterium]